jgi:hypothetical protein
MVCSKNGRFRVTREPTWVLHVQLILTLTSQSLLCRDYHCQANSKRYLWDYAMASLLMRGSIGAVASFGYGMQPKLGKASHPATLFTLVQNLPGELQWR